MAVPLMKESGRQNQGNSYIIVYVMDDKNIDKKVIESRVLHGSITLMVHLPIRQGL